MNRAALAKYMADSADEKAGMGAPVHKPSTVCRAALRGGAMRLKDAFSIVLKSSLEAAALKSCDCCFDPLEHAAPS